MEIKRLSGDKLDDVVFDLSGAYMNYNVPESQIYSSQRRAEEYQDWSDKDGIIHEAINKLTSLEDKEEKLGIDLNFFLSLIIDGAYFKVPKEISAVLRTSYDENEIVYKCPSSAEISKEGVTIEFYDRWDNTVDPEEYFYSINDYGKTWSLREEDLK